MNRIASIKAQAIAAAANNGDFNSLPLSAKTKVVFSTTARTLSGIQWWANVRDDDTQEDSFRKRAISEMNSRERYLPALYTFLNRAANYSGGKTQEVQTLVTEGDIDSYDITEEVEFVDTVVATNPHAWARGMLKASNQWPEDFENSDDDMSLPDVHKTYNKYAARLLALSVLASLRLYTPPEKEDDDTPSDIVLISALSKELRALADTEGRAFIAGVCRMIKKSLKGGIKVTSYVEGEKQEQHYSCDELIGCVNQMVEADQADAEAAAQRAADEAAINERKSIINEIKDVVRKSITIATVMGEVGRAATTMKAAGVGDDVIQSLTQGVMQSLGITPVAVTPTPALDTELETLKNKAAELEAAKAQAIIAQADAQKAKEEAIKARLEAAAVMAEAEERKQKEAAEKAAKLAKARAAKAKKQQPKTAMADAMLKAAEAIAVA